jgi:hypothetical protein
MLIIWKEVSWSIWDKAPNNNVFVCKSHYIDCLIKELGIDNSLDNPTLIAGRIPLKNNSVSKKICPSVIEMTLVGI